MSDRTTRESEQSRGAGHGGGGGATTNGGATSGGTGASTSGGAGKGGTGTGIPASARGDWSATVMPNAPGSGLPHIQRYTVGVDTAYDEVTGLTWQRHLEIYHRDFATAEPYCEALELDGKGGFRVPRLLELATLIDYLRDGHAIDESVFDVGNFAVVSSTKVVYTGDAGTQYYLLEFLNGTLTQEEGLSGTLCVSGGPSGELPQHYTVGPDTVVDNWTGLTWAPAPKDDYRVYDDAAAYCAALAIDGLSFRLPSYTEAFSVWDYTSTLPELDARAFSFSGVGPGFWSAPTPRMALPNAHARFMVGWPDPISDATVDANVLCVH